jgi:hypothetical protein
MPLEPTSTVLLGAGASKEAGVPTTFEMTHKLAEAIASRARDERLASALNYVCGALIAYDGAGGSSPFDNLDVERVFAAVQLLAERRTLEVTPFVASWHPAVDAWDRRAAPSVAFFDKRLGDALLENPGFNRAERLITDLIEAVTATGGAGEVYDHLASRMIEELRHLVAVTSKDVAYLKPLVLHGTGTGGLTVATLNYDLAVEGSGEANGIDVTTGVEDWLATGRWAWPPNGIRLLKLHGSINWVWTHVDEAEGFLPRRTISVTDSPADDTRDPVVVFGQRGKLQAAGPILGLLAEFETLLAKSGRLIVIGYSFRDDHVNQVIRRWTAEDIGRTIIVVDPEWPTSFRPQSNDFRADLERHLVPPAWKEAEFASRLEIWRIPCSEALRRLSR